MKKYLETQIQYLSSHQKWPRYILTEILVFTSTIGDRKASNGKLFPEIQSSIQNSIEDTKLWIEAKETNTAA